MCEQGSGDVSRFVKADKICIKSLIENCMHCLDCVRLQVVVSQYQEWHVDDENNTTQI